MGIRAVFHEKGWYAVHPRKVNDLESKTVINFLELVVSWCIHCENSVIVRDLSQNDSHLCYTTSRSKRTNKEFFKIPHSEKIAHGNRCWLLLKWLFFYGSDPGWSTAIKNRKYARLIRASHQTVPKWYLSNILEQGSMSPTYFLTFSQILIAGIQP